MSDYGVEMILGMANDLTSQYRKGYEAGLRQGKIEAYEEAIKVLKGEKDEHPE